MKSWNKVLIAGIALVVLVLVPMGGRLYGDEPLQDKILREIAAEAGVAPGRLELADLQAVAYPLTDAVLYQAKAVDTESGQVYGIVVDQGAKVQDLEAARSAEQAAREARYGRLHVDLYERLSELTDQEQVMVAIWLKDDGIMPLDRPALEHIPALEQGEPDPAWAEQAPAEESVGDKTDPDSEGARAERVAAIRAQQAERRAELEAAHQASLAHMSQQISAVQGPLLADLQAQGFTPAYVSPLAPLIYVEMPKAAILELSQRDDVDTVYGPHENQDAMATAKPTQKADVVDRWGFDGRGVDVAILEDSRIQFNNPYLNTGITRVPSGPVDQHATATAGMVASQHTVYQGIAQGADLLSANATDYSDPNLSAAMDWAVSRGAEVINNSWGSDAGTGLNEHDRHLDYIVRNHWRTVTVAAGNSGNGTGKVGSPARGWNVFSVGNFRDRGTLTWGDDDMSSSSSYVDPSTGCEKPEVAASGSSIESTTLSPPWVGNVGSGTSYAAPMVAGETALLMDRNSTLEIWPETIKAIIMATALHNIEGSSRLSERDGAGGVDMRAAFRTVDEGWFDGRTVTASGFPYSLYVYASAGETVRAAIAWNSNPSSNYSTDVLDADLDLRAYSPSGSVVAVSSSFNNSSEIVEFTAPTTGNYELRVTSYRFDGVREHVGAAWWPGHRVMSSYTTYGSGAPPISYDYLRLNAASGWNAVGIRPAGGSDHDIYLHANSAFGDPNGHGPLAWSSLLSNHVDFVLVDRNHAPSGHYYPEVRPYSGSGNYNAQWATRTATVDSGIYGPYTMSASQVLRIWDARLSAGVRTYLAVKPTSGNADLGMALYDSSPSTSSTWYRGRSQSVAYANASGAGGDEYMDYQTGTDDLMGLVVWNNGASSSTNFTLYADTSAPTGSIVINGGNAMTGSRSVNLTLSASDAQTGVTEMRFSNDGSSWYPWEPYATTKSWTLSSGDGTKTVYVQFKNNAGMASSSYSDTIVLDTVAPVGSILINGGAAYTASDSVDLTLSASDTTSGVAAMRFSNNGSSWSAWEPYATAKSWTLTAGDGQKTVYVRYRDHVGNVSSSYQDTIILDTLAPAGSIVVNNDDAYTNSTAATLTLSASDAGSGVAAMHFSNDGSTWSPWEPYATTKPWPLPAGDGPKTVYVRYRDHVGNVSASYHDTIILDTQAPTGSIQIEDGDTYSRSRSVELTLSASDTRSGVARMRFSNDGILWTDWEPYATTKSWTLTEGDGQKTVHVQYRDRARNVSTSYRDTIILDTRAPTGSIIIDGGKAHTGSVLVTLTLSASDATSGVSHMRFSNNGSTWEAWEPYATTKSWTLSTGDGEKTVYVRYRDRAGNSSSRYSDTIILDTLAPTGSITINGGADYTGSTAVNLALSASDAGTGVAEMRLSNDGSTWEAWESYATTKAWTLTTGDGPKTVYVQYRDHMGHVSSAYDDRIVLDTLAPTGSITINDGDAYTNATAATLTLSANDAGSGVAEMRLSDDGFSWGSWQAHTTPRSWTLPAGEGEKTVYVQYRDAVGNVSAIFNDTIILDTTLPTGSIVIDGGASYANSTAVQLTLSASDTGSGVAEMSFSDDGSTWEAWESYATTKSWTLPAGDGEKTVYVRYLDRAGNISSTEEDTITLDTVAPEGSIVINDGDTYAGSTPVELTLSADDATSGVSQMRFSNDGSTWSTWEAYATTRLWPLSSGDGEKTVYVQYEDQAGNLSDTYSDTIILDTLAPIGSIAINDGDDYTTSTAATLTLSASDVGSGVAEMRISDDGSTWNAWEPYATSKPWTLPVGGTPPGDGEKTAYVEYRDHVGRVSVVYSDTIVLDTTAPESSAASPANTYLDSFVVTWSGTDAHSGIASYDVQYRAGSGGTWTTWLSATSDVSRVFASTGSVTVVRGETYYFQVRARDNAGNLEAYPGGDGDTSTYVEELALILLPIVYNGSP